jgi:hypothetical protein
MSAIRHITDFNWKSPQARKVPDPEVNSGDECHLALFNKTGLSPSDMRQLTPGTAP